jgi:hypothetical protein
VSSGSDQYRNELVSPLKASGGTHTLCPLRAQPFPLQGGKAHRDVAANNGPAAHSLSLVALRR